jgi:MFS transporter, Spinster family, sphingosine-1-phosphate transporter
MDLPLEAPLSPSPPQATRRAARGAAYAVAVLTAMNLLNYVDRWVPSATKELFKRDLGLTDAQTSLPLTAFVLVYLVMSPIFASLADRWPRKVVIAGGVALWSLATGAAAFATGFWSFLLARALVGVGEAAYATLSPSLIGDLYPPSARNRILSLFYVAIPIGAAVGFAVGAIVGARFGWRAAFLACGAPGVLVAALALSIDEPARGAFDGDAGRPSPSWPEALRALARNRPFVITLAGYTAVTFASGALADWFPAFLARKRGMGVAEAGTLIGASAVLGGLGGTVAGGWLGDRLRGRTRQPYLALSAGSMAVAAVLTTLALLARARWAIVASTFGAQFFLWFYNGPINTLLVNSVGSALRPRAVGVSILCIHLFGDAISPPAVGALADATGSLPLAVLVVPLAMALGAGIWLRAWRRLPEEAHA